MTNPCKPSSFVDLKAFRDLPPLQELPAATQTNPEVQALYKTVQTYFAIDSKKSGLGNGNGLLELREIEKYLAKYPLKNPPSRPVGACDLLKEAEGLAAQAPKLKEELKRPPDLSPVELVPLKVLPYLDTFLKLPPAKTREEFLTHLSKSNLPKEMQDVLKKDETLAVYLAAKSYIEADLDKDGRLTVEDLQRLTQLNQAAGKTVSSSPVWILAEARVRIPQMALWGFQLQSRLSVKDDLRSIPLLPMVGLATRVPAFVETEPTLKALLEIIGKKNQKGQYDLIPEAQDGFLTLDEFRKIPAAQALKQKMGAGSEEAFFSKIRSLFEMLRQPIYLWPQELKDTLKKSGESSFQALSQIQDLNDDQRRAELILGFLETTSVAKYDQEKINHGGPAGDSYLAKIVGYALFRKSWKKHFQEDRPKKNKQERDQAIETLKKTLREQSFLKIEDAVAYLKANKGEAVAEVLEKKCFLFRWIKIAGLSDAVERSKALAQAKKDFRIGEMKSFWDWEILPSPRLGSGGFFQRASHLENWSWLKSPEIPLALAINNFLALKTPNVLFLYREPGTDLLFVQLSEEDRKTFQNWLVSASKGEAVDLKKAEALLSKAPLTQEGLHTLMAHLKVAALAGENTLVLQKVLDLPFVKKLSEEIKTLSEQIKKGPDKGDKKGPKKIKKLQEQLKLAEEKSKRLQSIFVFAAQGIEKVGKLEIELGMLGFKEADTKTLKASLRKIKVQKPPKETSGLETLLREGRFGDQSKRLRETLEKTHLTEAEQVTFQELVSKSPLAASNKKILVFALKHREETHLAREAAKEFMDILGVPLRDSKTGDWDAKSVGNLHNAIRTTVVHGVGLGILGAPTLAGGGVGYALARNYSPFGFKIPFSNILVKAPPSSFPIFLGAGLGVAIGSTSSDQHKLRNSLLGAGIGGVAAYGINTLFKKMNPWWGALAVSVLGALATVSPWGKSIRDMGGEVTKIPYRPWSDFSVSDLPQEALGLYLDFAVGIKGMEGILGGVRLIGAMEMGSWLASKIRLPPLILDHKITSSLVVGGGLGALTGYDLSSKKDGITTLRDMALGAAHGGLFSYGMFTNKLLTVTLAAAEGGAYYGHLKMDHGRLFGKDIDPRLGKIIDPILAGLATGAMVFLLGRGLRTSLEKLTGAEAEMISKSTPLHVEEVQRKAAQGQLKWISPWAEKRYQELMEQIARVEAFPNLPPERILMLRQEAAAYAKVGTEGAFPRYSARIVSLATKSAEGGTPEGLEQARRTILRGAADLHMMEKGTITQSKIAKILLTGTIADRLVDPRLKPRTPLTPPFDDKFQGNPRVKPAAKGF